MVASRQMASFVEAVTVAEAKLVLIGDPDQLQPIEAGAAFRANVHRVGYAELETIYRQKQDWMRTASLDLARGRIEKARETRHEGQEMMQTYLGEDPDGLDGFEFLTMAEAGEVGHWKVVEKLNEQLGDRDLKELTDFAVPLQEDHFHRTLECSLVLAGQEDPTATA